MTPEMITKITESVLTVIALLVSAYVIPWLKTKIEADRLSILNKFIESTVRAAEQLYKTSPGSVKKEYVVKLVTEKANALGIGLNEAEIDAIIEGIVNYVKE